MSTRLILIAVLTFALPLSAQAQNVLIPVQGLLTDSDNQPVEGQKTLQFNLVSQSGEFVWTGYIAVDLKGGLFSVYLGQETDLPASVFGEEGAVALDLMINGDSLGAWPIGSVPYAAQALHAHNAQTLDGQTADAFAGHDHSHALSAGSGLAVDNDGNLALAEGGVGTQHLAGEGCAGGQILKWDGATWGCAADENNDTQLSEEQVDTMVSNNRFVVGPAEACAAGQLLKASENGWVCAADEDADTTYTAGSAISLSNANEFYIADGAITQTQIGADAVRANELADNSVDRAAMRDNSVGAAEIVNDSISHRELADNAVGNAEMQDDAIGTSELVNGAVTRGKLNQSGCTIGQILKYTNSGWACAADGDTNTTYSAGTGLNLNGTTFSLANSGVTQAHLANDSVGVGELRDNSVNLAAMTNDSVGSDELRSNSVGSSEIAAGAVGASELADGTITNAKIADNAQIAGHKVVYHDELYVPGTGTDIENGTALRTALNNINASLNNRKVIRIGPGNFDLGTNYVSMDSGLTVIGAGRNATKIWSARPGSYVLQTKKGSLVSHLAIANDDIDNVNSSKVIYNAATSDGDIYTGEAFKLDNVVVTMSGNQNATNMLIDNRGKMLIDNCYLKNETGGTGFSVGIYGSANTSYTRVVDTMIYVNNTGSQTGEKFNVWIQSDATIHIYSSRLVQSATNVGNGRALYAKGGGFIYAYSSAVYGKTYSAYESSANPRGNVTFFGGRMSNNETSGVTCRGMRSWDGNESLDNDCDG